MSDSPHRSGQQPATLLPRFAARLLDLVVVGFVALIVSALLRVVVGGYTAGAMSAVIGGALYLGYFVVMESSRGQTLGKMALGLRVVGPDGDRLPTLEEAVRRNLWTLVGLLGVLGTAGSYLGSLVGLISVVVIAVTISADTRDRRSWFDTLAGGTQVVSDLHDVGRVRS